MMGNYHVRFDRGLRGKVSKDNSPLCLPNSGVGHASLQLPYATEKVTSLTAREPERCSPRPSADKKVFFAYPAVHQKLKTDDQKPPFHRYLTHVQTPRLAPVFTPLGSPYAPLAIQ